jgi:hypothetical protein
MTMRVTRLLALGASLIVIGCSGEPTSASIASSLTGSWVRLEEFPGNDFEMRLAADGSSLSGTGTFVGRAGPGGTITVVGTVTRDTVNLDFTLQAELSDSTVTSTAHFTGRLILQELRGTLQYGNTLSLIVAPSTVFIRKHYTPI